MKTTIHRTQCQLCGWDNTHGPDDYNKCGSCLPGPKEGRATFPEIEAFFQHQEFPRGRNMSDWSLASHLYRRARRELISLTDQVGDQDSSWAQQTPEMQAVWLSLARYWRTHHE